jgi:hypothetical protein
MYKSIDIPAQNSVVVSGTLLSLDSREGKAKKTGKPYRSLNTVVRVNQFYNGKEETSEIPLDFIAMKFKKDGTNNSMFDTYGEYVSKYQTAERHGLEAATHVQVNGRRGNGVLTENMFIDSRNEENVISTWRIGSSFLNEVYASSVANKSDCATFDVEIFIMNIDRELSNMGEETGRLKIRGGIVQYGRKLDIFDFFVENPEAVDYIERNYSINDTAHFVGRIRYTSETVISQTQNSWGESIPKTTTSKKHELIITGPGAGAADGPLDEERSYSPDEIRVLVADRNTRKEQIKIENKNKAAVKTAAESVAPAKYGWEE